MTNDVSLWTLWSRFGDEEFYMVVAVVLYYFLPRPQQGLALVIAVLLSGSLNMALKYAFNLPRPPNPLVEVSGPSFPSGHAQVSSSFWSSLSLLAKKAIVTVISGLMIVGISLSRVSLRAHNPVDVVVGALIGCAVGCASYLTLRHYTKRRSFAGYYVSAGVAVALSTYNFMAFEADPGSSMALLGLSLAALTALPILKSVEPVKSSILFKGFVSAISVALLSVVHTATRGYVPYARLACFYAAGLCLFLMSLASQALLKRPWLSYVRASG